MALFSSTSISSAAGGYDIDNSCRLDRASSSKFTRATWTSSAADRRKWTYSVWFKVCGNFGTARDLFFCGTHDECMIANSPADKIDWFTENASARKITNRVFRDVGAWYHAVFVMDTTLATAGDRMKLYINGVRETSFSTSSNPTQNHQTKFGDGSSSLYLGSSGSSNYWDGYFSEAHFVQGQALDASSFGEVDEDYGHWKAKKYEGTYGDGFYLDFKSSGSLGNDANGSNNFVVTDLVASDQVADSPTNNFSTLNVNAKALNHTYTEGNLQITGTSGQNRAMSTFGFDSGKWYYEVLILAYGGTHPAVGVVTTQAQNARNTTFTGDDAGGYGYYGAGGVNHGGSTNGGTYATYTAGDIIGVACDMDNLKVYFYKNGSNAITSGTAYETLVANTTYAFATSIESAGFQVANFGQDGTFAGNKTAAGNSDANSYGNFFHSVPSGFLAACSKNLSDPTIKPAEHFNTILYTGTGSSNARTGVGFQPDLVWIKNRGTAYSHQPYDSVRGVQKKLHTDSTNAETTDSTGLTAFGSDGFTVGSNVGINEISVNQVAWCWKANGSGSSNTDGSINTTSTSANVAGGFSISTYTGTGSNATVGHGLSKAPNYVIVKSRSTVDDWIVGSVQSVASMDFTDNLVLHYYASLLDSETRWHDLPPTASVVNIGTAGQSNQSSVTYVMYCWHSVEGYSKIGAYTGNANRDGTFVYLGFRPAFVMIKNTAATFNWVLFDSARDPYNEVSWVSRPDINNADYYGSDAYFAMDFCSNGIKFRENDGWFSNANTYLYIAFAETPFKYANAR